MANITRRTTKKLINQMLTKYQQTIEVCREYKTELSAEAIKIVNDYEKNEIGRLITKILQTEDYFSNYEAADLYKFFDNIRALLTGLDIKLPRDAAFVDGITDKEEIKLVREAEKEKQKKPINPKRKIKLQLLKGNEGEESKLSRLRYNIEWTVENIETKETKKSAIDAIENESVLFDQTDRSFTFKEEGKYKITAYVYEKDLWGRKELVDIVSYEQVVVGENHNTDEASYEPGWLFVTNKDKQVTKIINNDGNNIIFLDTKGNILKSNVFIGGKYTKFFGENLGISQSAANELLIKAQYSWIDGKMQNGYKAFDLNGNEAEVLIDGNTVHKKIKSTPNLSMKEKKVVSPNSSYLKQRPLEEKYGYPYTAPSFGSLCLATSIINLYILDDGLSIENVEKFMDNAKGKFIEPNGKVISFENMSRKLSELSGDEKYFDYVYYNPETKTYSANKKAMSKEDFIKSDYEYGIGAYIHLDDDPEDPDIEIAHYELIKRSPFTEYNPGISAYQLYEIYPVSKYKR